MRFFSKVRDFFASASDFRNRTFSLRPNILFSSIGVLRCLIIFFAVCVFFLNAASCANPKKLETKTLTIKKADGGEVSVVAEIAVKEEERNRGFMERKSIPDGTGMLFVFESDQILSFWMKNTPTPLSIAYIDSRGKIRDILDMTPHSLAPVISTSRVRYALEVPQGWFTKVGVKTGDVLVIENSSANR